MTVCESEVIDPVKMSRAVFPPSGIYEVSFALSRSKCDRTIILREENQFSAEAHRQGPTYCKGKQLRNLRQNASESAGFLH